ncbi:MAG: efflux RND transporter permease subunit [Betaproteobacteria bacterium]|nr:MAG: efflux RND transporter permease subunit [Betaproteobacteria bacterium]
MNLSTWSIRNPIPVVLMFLLLSLAGVWGFKVLGIQDFPDLDMPAVSVSLKLTGGAPAQLETEIARKVEDKIATLRGLKNMNTTITDGEVSISVQFAIGTSLSDALLDVKDAVDSVRGDLPVDMQEPQISKVALGPGGPTLTYAVTNEQMDEESLSWFTDDVIARTVLSVNGVGKFTRVGGVQREVQVHVSPAKLNALGVTALDVSRALKRVQQDSSGGRGQIGGSEQGVRTIATVQRAQDLLSLSISLADGRSVRLDQVADVRDTVSERSQAALFDGKPAIGFQISRNKGVDEITMEKAIKSKLVQLQLQSPGLDFNLIKSNVSHTKEQYRGSMHMLIEGALLAVLVIGWYLRDWRATLIGAAALPLSILPTFAFMALAGYTLNTITLLALAVVVGVLVDDAIVEVENIARHMKNGKSVRQATEEAVNEIWMAVLATTAALVVVFLPTAFMSGTPGLVFKQFGWTVVVSVLASLLVARMATPLMAVWLLKYRMHDDRDGRAMRWYLGVASWCLRHRVKTMLAALVLFIGSLALVPLMTTGFIPASDKGTSTVDIELPPGTPLATTLAIAEEARQAIAGVKGMSGVFITAGAAQGAGDPRRGTAGEVRKASLNVLLAERGTRASQQDIENALRPRLQSIPGIRWSISGGGPGEKLQIILASQDATALKASAEDIAKQMRDLPFLSGVSSNASLERPEITVRPDSARAAERGVTTQAIGETLRVATSGDFTSAIAKLNLDQRQLDIVVRFPNELRQDAQSIAALRVAGREGLVPLESVANITMESGPSQITRYNRSRNVTLTADLGGYPLSEALNAVKALPAAQALPGSVRLVESGDAEVMKDLFLGFALALLTGVLCKYCVLVLLYKNWFQPFTNLSALPLSVGGALAALLAFSGELNLPALIGIVMLFGVVTKNSILIIDYAFVAMRDQGMNEIDALLDACHKRARPIMMTTVAMVAGMLPLAIGYGGDSSFRQPMAIAVIGGLIASTALSLIVVPVVSTYMSSIERFFSGRRKQSLPAVNTHTVGASK